MTSRSMLTGFMIFIIIGFSVASLYMKVLTREQAGQLTMYAIRKEDLLVRERSLQELIIRYNATLSEDLTKEALLADIHAKSVQTQQTAQKKSNQTPTNESVIERTEINSTPAIQINPPARKPRVTRAS